MRENLEAGAHRAALRVVGAVDQAGYAPLNHRAGAHAARLDGDIEGGIGEAVVSKNSGRFAKDNHLSVGGGIAIADSAVAGARESFSVMDEDGADGNFAGGSRGTSLGQRFLHVFGVSTHAGRENNMHNSSQRIGRKRL